MNEVVILFVSILFLFQQAVSQMLMAYLSRLSAIADNKINCGPVLTWMEVLPWCYLTALFVSVEELDPLPHVKWALSMEASGFISFQLKSLEYYS